MPTFDLMGGAGGRDPQVKYEAKVNQVNTRLPADRLQL
jgi:hypothetical protein